MKIIRHLKQNACGRYYAYAETASRRRSFLLSNGTFATIPLEVDGDFFNISKEENDAVMRLATFPDFDAAKRRALNALKRDPVLSAQKAAVKVQYYRPVNATIFMEDPIDSVRITPE